MTEREQQILAWIQQNPMISQQELANLAGITRSGIAAHISNLIRKGYLRGKGYIVTPPSYVTVVGGISMDVLGIACGDLMDYTSNASRVRYMLGGVGRNIAVALERLNVRTSMVSVYGGDHNGELFRIDAAANGLDIGYAKQLPDSMTASYMYVGDASGQRLLALDDMSIYDHMTPDFLRERMSIIENADILVLDTNIPQKSFEWLCDRYRRPIIVRAITDAKAPRVLSRLSRIDTLVLDTAESQALTGINAIDERSATRCAGALLKRGVKNVFVNAGRAGVAYGVADEGVAFYPVPVKRVQRMMLAHGNGNVGVEAVGNDNGSSDAATAALIYARYNEFDPAKTGRFAVAAAALNTESMQPVHESLNPELIANRMVDIHERA
nr:PfkB family carbohydrate kinase [uncultured Gardnerella sp.]